MTVRSLTMLNEAGDTTIVWDADGDDRMRQIIEAKMKAGVTFFIIEPRFLGLLPPKRTRLKAIEGNFCFTLPDREARFFCAAHKAAGDAFMRGTP